MGLLPLLLYLALSWVRINDREVVWSAHRPLTYADFRGRIPSNSPWAATTRSTIRFSYETVNGALTQWEVRATFDPQASWMRVKEPAVLQHEQLHFDITEVYARKFCRHLQRLQGSRVMRPMLKELFDTYNRQCDSVHIVYDQQTQHGTLTAAQAAWRDTVSRWLESHEPCP
ncbi:MAG: DUF922 domain-containing protein [Chitinophagales bacterium]|nr:DUF922 domain-containing protein [Chitinophagales bacterium]MDW8427658.1 DUF922 domain-containing protein [Chitinophagales bacterium]